jgi:imidazole glycerol phosphate synthase subunit HisF
LDAKRIIPMLEVAGGKVAAEGRPAAQAGLLELAGADGLHFEDDGSPDRAWLTEAAGAVFLPLAVTCGSGEPAAMAALLEAGADAVVVPAVTGDLPRLAALARDWGCQGPRVAVALDWAPGSGWTGPGGRDAMAWLEDLIEQGAGEFLLTLLEAHRPGLDALCQGLARLPVPVLVRTGSWDLGREALLHGADGLVYPASLGSPAACKAFLAASGLPIRQ